MDAKKKERIDQMICEQLCVDEDDVKPQANFNEDLGADSLDMVDLAMQFEEEYDIEIPDEDTESIKTVQDLYDYLEKRTA